jgi:hypothetical protein
MPTATTAAISIQTDAFPLVLLATTVPFLIAASGRMSS